MFDIWYDDQNDVHLKGRLDAAAAPTARVFLEDLQVSTRLDFTELEYMASAGLGLLAATQRRLMEQGGGLTLAGLTPHLREVLALAGFEGIFDFE